MTSRNIVSLALIFATPVFAGDHHHYSGTQTEQEYSRVITNDAVVVTLVREAPDSIRCAREYASDKPVVSRKCGEWAMAVLMTLRSQYRWQGE